ncbi:LLM class flavin-dependent oxidoreductase [Streptomyces sp. NPDC057253]|uniref:LLM class flavin-dependent oxidoreductase n=1 Tax=Streptomyces sp. NPDC057253 TaxID=3346069 RepID=UPI00363FD8BF
MTALGAVFRPQLPPERLRALARLADEAGLEELWLWEDCFLEGGISTAAAALAWTERLRVGVGLLPVPLRNVAITAMEAATLHRMFPGRPILAVGHGVQDWMGQVGARAESPLTLLREHLDALRALLSGERITTRGRYVSLDGVALDWPPDGPVEVLTGATGPRTLRLAGECADGTVLTAGTSPEGVRRARRLIDEGRQKAGRTGQPHQEAGRTGQPHQESGRTGQPHQESGRTGQPHDEAGRTEPPHRVVVYLLTATGPDATARLHAELAQEGHADVPDLGVAGDADTVAKAVQRLADAGADTVVLQPTADEPNPEAFVRFTAEQVRPLLP